MRMSPPGREWRRDAVGTEVRRQEELVSLQKISGVGV